MTGLDLERQVFRVSGGELAYVDVGEGPPVLLLHGFPTSAFLWRREIWLLAQGMRVIAPDLLGYGQSAKPADVDLSEPAQAGYVRELLVALSVAIIPILNWLGAIPLLSTCLNPWVARGVVSLASAVTLLYLLCSNPSPKQ